MKKIIIPTLVILLMGIISAQVGNHSMPTDILDTCTDGFMICFAKWASDVTIGVWWFAALFAFCVILFLATLRFGTPRAFGFASFVGMIGGVWMSILGLFDWGIGSVFIIVGVIGLAVMLISEKG